MNIIILSNSKQQQGGVERFGFYLQQCLEKQGHHVTLLGKEDIGTFEKSILKIKKVFGMEHPALGYFLGRKALATGFDLCITNGMLGWNINNKNVINVQHGTFARAADRIDRDRSGSKYFVKKYVWGFFEGLAARRATQCVAVSTEVKESVEHYYHANNVMVIYNAVDIDLFKPMDQVMCRGKMKLPIDKKIALFVGRLEYAKGKVILEGLKTYLNQHDGILIVAESYSQEELTLLCGASDVFLLPSLHEGCSYALLEAMSSGLPFLASPVGLVPELEQQGLFTEYIVHDQTVEAYVQAMKNFFEKTDEQEKLLKEQLRAVTLERYTIEQFGKAYAELVEKIGS
jgi:glycosyltransferase involved in cell wall biosynthesis